MFAVVLGPDFAGKSSALAALRGCRVVSTDRRFVAARHEAVSRLRGVVGRLDGEYSPDFLAALLQTAVVHLRDEVLRADEPLVVDSYYYKILAKCRLAGVQDNPMFDWWRTFPQPARVIYLTVSPDTAWRRSGAGAKLNPLEHHGEHPTRAGFERYQRDLAKLMWEEIRDLPVTVLDERDSSAATAQAIREVLDDEFR